MVKKRGRLQIVAPATSVFDDLDALRKAQATTPAAPGLRKRRRPRITEPFAAVTYALARKLRDHRVSGTAWFLLTELDRLIFEPKGRCPLRLTSATLEPSGLSPREVSRALHQLERAGVITVGRHPGRSPVVTPLWHPKP